MSMADEMREHLQNHIVPFWQKLEDKEYGGFYGYMGPDLAVDKKAVKGCILNSRILWFFSNASMPPWNSMAPVIPAENFTDERKEGKTAFTGTHEEVLEKYLWLLDYAQDDFMGTTYTDGNAAFANGAAAMMINGNWAISEFLNTNPDMNVNMFAFPSVDEADRNTVTSGVDVLLAVSNQGDEAQQEAAKEFIRYALTPEVAQSYIDDQFAFSAVNGVEQKNETVSGVSKDIANGIPLLAGPVVQPHEGFQQRAGFDVARFVADVGGAPAQIDDFRLGRMSYLRDEAVGVFFQRLQYGGVLFEPCLYRQLGLVKRCGHRSPFSPPGCCSSGVQLILPLGFCTESRSSTVAFRMLLSSGSWVYR